MTNHLVVDNNQNSDYDLEIYNLSKVYKLKGKKKIVALKDINLKVKRGEIFGLLGPNGAGKTTLVSILTTLIQPTSGYAIFQGHNILQDGWYVRENAGLMLGGEMIYRRLTGYRNLKFFCKIYGIKNYREKINDFAAKFNLTKWLNQYVSNYSKGMKLKLALARVLLIEPKMLFLDEPMLGLDPVTIKEVIKILRNLNITIFITSHQMDVVDKLCDRIAFLREGKILKIDNQENFKKLISEEIKLKLKISRKKQDFIKAFSNLEFVSNIIDDDFIIFNLKSQNFFPTLFEFLKDYPIQSFNEIKPSLDDVFIKLSN